MTGPGPSEWLSAGEATERLDVKPETLYAYVSRGLVRSERLAGGRRARYLRADVERLARRGRRSAPRPGPEIVLDSAITLLDPAGRLSYRGVDAVTLARTSSYEATAGLLWGVPSGTGLDWTAPHTALEAAHAAQRHLPTSASLPDRLRLSAAVIAPFDPLRDDRRPESVANRATRAIATLVEALPLVDGATPPLAASPVATRLWPRLTAAPPNKSRLAALDRALILLADHELATSTYAVRVAASTWADPYLLLLTGLSAAGGPLHAGASAHVRALLREVVRDGSAEASVAARLRSHGSIPGFGHAVYQGIDPRALALLDAIAPTRPSRVVQRAADTVLEIVATNDGPHPNVDFALGVLTEGHSMVDGAGEAVFVLGRCAGWIADGLEEYPHRLRYRTRASYTGPFPEDA